MDSDTNDIRQLAQFLALLPPGPIEDADHLVLLLSSGWTKLKEHDAEGMDAEKLLGRLEDPRWNPPELTFTIERHGGTVMGSSRAERHLWTLSSDNWQLRCAVIGYRQIRPRQAKVDVLHLAREFASLIRQRQQDERLRWMPSGEVEVMIGKLFPTGSAVSQTLAGRRKRFREGLGHFLQEMGWEQVRPNKFKEIRPS